MLSRWVKPEFERYFRHFKDYIMQNDIIRRKKLFFLLLAIPSRSEVRGSLTEVKMKLDRLGRVK